MSDLMKVDEAIGFYFEKKTSLLENERLTKDQIRTELKEKHNFSDDESAFILREIVRLELEDVQNPTPVNYTFLTSIWINIIFLIAALIVIGYSFYILQLQLESAMSKTLPYVMIVGGLLLAIRHVQKIVHHIKK